MELYEEIRSANVAKIVSDIMNRKLKQDELKKTLTTGKIDWMRLLK